MGYEKTSRQSFRCRKEIGRKKYSQHLSPPFPIQPGRRATHDILSPKKKGKTYHIDYCFASNDIAENLKSVKVGDYDFWMQHSDHVPVIVTFKL